MFGLLTSLFKGALKLPLDRIAAKGFTAVRGFSAMTKSQAGRILRDPNSSKEAKELAAAILGSIKKK